MIIKIQAVSFWLISKYIIGSACRAAYKEKIEINRSTTLYGFLNSSWPIKLLDNYSEIAKVNQKNSLKGSRMGGSAKMNTAKRAILSRLSIWTHIHHKTDNGSALTLTIPAQTNLSPLPIDFLKLLIEKLPLNDPKRQYYLDNLSSGNRLFGYYLNRQKRINKLYGFVLQNPEPNSPILKRSVPGQPITNDDLNRLKSRSRDQNGRFIVENETFCLKHFDAPQIPIITVRPNQFILLSDLAKHVLNTYNKHKTSHLPKQQDSICVKLQI